MKLGNLVNQSYGFVWGQFLINFSKNKLLLLWVEFKFSDQPVLDRIGSNSNSAIEVISLCLSLALVSVVGRHEFSLKCLF